jgi:hypothetical protein
MRRTFRAFLWMRWRILVNSLERTGARDRLERMSVATDKLGPIIALVLLIPSSIALFVLGLIAGFGIATSGWTITMEFVRYFLLFTLALTCIGPLILPTRDSSSIVRLILLPIPRLTLFIGQMVAAIADPWIVLIVPAVLGVAIGLAIGLKFIAALIALVAGAAFVLFVLGLTSLLSSIVHLLLRDRRRGEIVMFVFVLIIPIVAMAPQFLVRAERQGARRLTPQERAALPPSRFAVMAIAAAPYIPSEMYRRATLTAVTSPVRATFPFGVLAAIAFAIQATAYAAYRRVLDMPVSLGARKAGAFGGLWNRRIPGMTPAASAIALTQLRLGLRTPRGRASITSPLLMPVILAAVTYRVGHAPIPGLTTNSGFGLAVFGVVISLMALLPLAMNQFAIDKAGFTRQMLVPLSVRELLFGKAVGNALIALIPAIFCLVIPAVMFPLGPRVYWLALILGALATYALLAPAAAALSALFPKTVDLNSIGNASNAHQAAGLLGMLSFAASAAPAVLLSIAAVKLLHRPDLLPVLMVIWCLAAAGLSYLLFVPVARFVDSRRETLAQYY